MPTPQAILSQICFFESFVIRKPLNLQHLIFRFCTQN
jgi:hypothetical protein